LPAATGAELAGADAEVAAGALHAAGTRRAVFSRADVVGQVAALLPTAGLSAAEVLSRVEQLTDLALGLDGAVPIGAQSVGVTARASDAATPPSRSCRRRPGSWTWPPAAGVAALGGSRCPR